MTTEETLPTLEEYMSGTWTPPPVKKEKPPKAVDRPHWYGLGPGPSYAFFYVSSAEKVPAGASVVEEGPETIDEVRPRLRELRSDFRQGRRPPVVEVKPVVEPGVVAWHEDDRGSHMAIILDVCGNECTAVLLTSKPGWSQRAATSDELALVGFAASRRTYLAVGTWKKWEFEPGRLSLPAHRLEALRAEFVKASKAA